jgi:hypothetical protein
MPYKDSSSPTLSLTPSSMKMSATGYCCLNSLQKLALDWSPMMMRTPGRSNFLVAGLMSMP